MRVLCLVFDSDPDVGSWRETYDSHRHFWNKHFNASPVEGFFMRSDPNLDVEHKIEERTITVRSDAGHGLGGTIHRMIRAIDILLEDHQYVITTGLSNLIDFRVLQDRSVVSGVYAGHIVHDDGPYVSGAGTLMSNDVARILVEFKDHARSQWVDVAVGEILRARGIVPQEEPMFCIDYTRGVEQLQKGFLRYRVKDEAAARGLSPDDTQRVREREMMRAVFEYIHE